MTVALTNISLRLIDRYLSINWLIIYIEQHRLSARGRVCLLINENEANMAAEPCLCVLELTHIVVKLRHCYVKVTSICEMAS